VVLQSGKIAQGWLYNLLNIENLVLSASLCVIYDFRLQIEAACTLYREVLSS
jgi:hypothetical protein